MDHESSLLAPLNSDTGDACVVASYTRVASPPDAPEPSRPSPAPAPRRVVGRPFTKGNSIARDAAAERAKAPHLKATFQSTLRAMYGPDSRTLLERIDAIATRPIHSAKDAAVSLQANTLLLAYQQGRPVEKTDVRTSLSSQTAELAALGTAALVSRIAELVARWPTAQLPPALASLPTVIEARRADIQVSVVEAKPVEHGENAARSDETLSNSARETALGVQE